MTRLDYYKCDICGTVYDDVYSCRYCEGHHVTNLNIVGAEYVSVNDIQSGMPKFITLKDNDGFSHYYKEMDC